MSYCRDKFKNPVLGTVGSSSYISCFTHIFSVLVDTFISAPNQRAVKNNLANGFLTRSRMLFFVMETELNEYEVHMVCECISEGANFKFCF